MVRTVFDASLKELHNDLLKMGNIVQNQICNSIKALINKDESLANEIIKNDDIVDDWEKKIEDKAIKLIATQQPLARDLRKIFTITKIVTDLERMADHTVDISKITKKLKNQEYISELIYIPCIANIIKEMVEDSLKAYISGNIDMAYKICKKDDEVDKLYTQVFNKTLDIMRKDYKYTNQVTQFLFICKFLERIADHTTNICEWTIYLVTGKQVDLNE